MSYSYRVQETGGHRLTIVYGVLSDEELLPGRPEHSIFSFWHPLGSDHDSEHVVSGRKHPEFEILKISISLE